MYTHTYQSINNVYIYVCVCVYMCVYMNIYIYIYIIYIYTLSIIYHLSYSMSIIGASRVAEQKKAGGSLNKEISK